jgi:hypothetical protein
LGYLFDIFTKFSGKLLAQESLYSIFTIFADVPDTDQALSELKGVKTLNRKDFIDLM